MTAPASPEPTGTPAAAPVADTRYRLIFWTIAVASVVMGILGLRKRDLPDATLWAAMAANFTLIGMPVGRGRRAMTLLALALAVLAIVLIGHRIYTR